MEGCERFILEGFERCSELVKLSLDFDAGQDFLPDWADDYDPAILNCFFKGREDELLFSADGSPAPPPQQD